MSRKGEVEGMREVEVALHRGRGLIGGLIRWQSRSVYSHAALVIDGRVYESREFRGVRDYQAMQNAECRFEIGEGRINAELQTGVPINQGEQIDIFSVAVTGEQLQVMRGFLNAQRDKGYDYLSVARFVSRRDEGSWGKDRWFCSELVFAAFLEAGIELLRGTRAWEVSPGLLGRSPILKWKRTVNKCERDVGYEDCGKVAGFGGAGLFVGGGYGLCAGA